MVTGIFAVAGLIIGGYEVLKSQSSGVYDLIGGGIWGVFYLVLTALHHNQQEKEQRLYNQSGVYS